MLVVSHPLGVSTAVQQGSWASPTPGRLGGSAAGFAAVTPAGSPVSAGGRGSSEVPPT